MISAIEAFILVLSPAAAVFASAIFLYESVITASNLGACSSVIFSVSFHFAVACFAMSSGDMVDEACLAEVVAALVVVGAAVAAFAASSSALLARTKSGVAHTIITRTTRLKRANFMRHLPCRYSVPHAWGRGLGYSREVL